MKLKYFQFIKSSERTYGEQIALRKLGVETVQLGVGFTVHQLKYMLRHLKDLYEVRVAIAYTKRIVHLCCGN